MVIFHILVYQPLYNILITLYNIIPGQDFGISIIFFTVILRFALMPVYKKQIESQKKLQEFQPRIKEIQNKHKNNKEKQNREIMEFYKKNKINPFSGCLPLVIQSIFLIAIYKILTSISNSNFLVNGSYLYPFVSNPESIRHTFLGIIDLTRPSIPLAIMAAVAQFYQTKMLIKKQPILPRNTDEKMDFAQIMNKQMLVLFPIMTLFIGIKFAAGLALYWLVSTLFTIIQQWQMEKTAKNPKEV